MPEVDEVARAQLRDARSDLLVDAVGGDPTKRTSDSTETTIELPTRPPMNTLLGSGVPLVRFRRPFSRSTVSEIAKLCRVAETTASAMIAGT